MLLSESQMKLTFHPLDFHYRIRDEAVLVYMFGKQENGPKICVALPHQPYFFVEYQPFLKERLSTLTIPLNNTQAKVTKVEEVEKEFLGKKEKFLQVFTNIPKAVPPLSQQLESEGLRCYEKDILFIHRFLRDTSILPLAKVEVEGDFADESLRIPFFLATKLISTSSSTLPLRILSIDIETYARELSFKPERNPVLFIALSGTDEAGKAFQKVLTWKEFPHSMDCVEVLNDEKAMLQRFNQLLIEYKPDILTGYNSDGFDLPYLKVRADKFQIKLDAAVDYSALQAERESSLAGIVHLDIFQFIRHIHGKNMKAESYSLNNVAQELLGHQKHKVDISKLYLAWDEQPEQLETFCSYNLHDADLNLKLCAQLLPDIIEFSHITGLPLSDVIRTSFSRLVESYILRRAKEFNVLAPNRPSEFQLRQRREESFEGAFVYQPTPGLYHDLVVFDFRSLYPSIIISHNIGPEALHCSCCTDNTVPGLPEYWFCRQKKFLPSLLEELIKRRAEIKKQLKVKKDDKLLQARSLAVKMLANSFYGYLGFSGARWYCFECARSTTAYARNYIHDTITKAETAGFKVCYSDTDSCFILLGEKKLDDALQFMKNINKDLPGQMELEFENFYPRGLFVALKSSEQGAKKKYALLSAEGKLKIIGFETVRRNWSVLAKEVQEHVLRLVLEEKNDEALKYAQAVAEELKAGKISKDKVIIKTKITRNLDDYASVGPHVAVARQMEEKGQKIPPGTLVEYVIVKGSGIIRERAKIAEEAKEGEYDPQYYLDHQLLPAVSSIFAVLGYKEDELFSDSKQKGLGEFFG